MFKFGSVSACFCFLEHDEVVGIDKHWEVGGGLHVATEQLTEACTEVIFLSSKYVYYRSDINNERIILKQQAVIVLR